MKYWIVSSKHSRDESTKEWDSKWTADNFLRTHLFYPSKRIQDFHIDDLCILKLFSRQDFIGNFRIASDLKVDEEEHKYYEIDNIEEWDYPINQHTLPQKYTIQLSRIASTEISERDYYELMGIRNFTQNLKLNYKNRLWLSMTEADFETLIDSRNALEQIGLEIIDRQIEITPGNRIDLLCKDQKGDLVVVELKKWGATQTIGQTARYLTDVREHYAKTSQKVRALILAFDIDEELIKAARGVDFEVSLCQIAVG